jgi:large subunit ribosomal protein L17
MRHQKSGRKFSRTSAHRKAMFSNMVASLVIHERIETTSPKAKELSRLADRTISWGTSVADLTTKDRAKLSADERQQVVHAQRMARRVLKQPDALHKLFHEIAPRFGDRPGGFTRVLPTRVRPGDAAPMSFVELTAAAEAPKAKKAEPEKPDAKAPKAKVTAKGKKAAAAEAPPTEKGEPAKKKPAKAKKQPEE